ncbi:MAG: BNR-4 repeat-containing protein [Lentisphaeria bacterium]|nr:BNR-4 repeat-containing protein [Lentisphaeria bacterium]
MLDIPAGESRPVILEGPAPPPGETWNCRLRATTDSFTTFSSLVLKHGRRDQLYDFTPPLVLTPYHHENDQFAYAVDYPLGGQPYFDLENRPVIYSGNRIHTWRNGAWTPAVINLTGNQDDNTFARARVSKIAFDRDNWYYTIAADQDQPVLLYSADLGKTFAAVPLPCNGAFDIEQFSGHNLPDDPPPIMCHTVTERDPQRIWRRVHDVKLLLPQKEGGRIVLPEPITVSRSGIGFSAHSGIPSSMVSRGNNVHLIWAEATDPDDKSIPGVPTYTATCNRLTGALSQPALIGYGPPANDVHNTPCLTMDSKGYLHGLVGTHGNTFRYARSLQPDTAAQGWTEAVPLGDQLSQTYVGLISDQNDILHVVFRLARPPQNTFPAGSSSSLSLMSKPAQADAWPEPRQLVLPAFTDYCVYYHRLVIDRSNRIFLSYDYWSTYWFYRNDQARSRRALMMSPDGAQKWRLASDRDLRGKQ